MCRRWLKYGYCAYGKNCRFVVVECFRIGFVVSVLFFFFVQLCSRSRRTSRATAALWLQDSPVQVLFPKWSLSAWPEVEQCMPHPQFVLRNTACWVSVYARCFFLHDPAALDKASFDMKKQCASPVEESAGTPQSATSTASAESSASAGARTAGGGDRRHRKQRRKKHTGSVGSASAASGGDPSSSSSPGSGFSPVHSAVGGASPPAEQVPSVSALGSRRLQIFQGMADDASGGNDA